MIKYALRCAAGHAFESWFSSSSAYDKLAAAGEVACPECGATTVEKDIMAPALGASAKHRNVETYASGLRDHGPDVDPKARIVLEAARRIREHLEAEGRYVGRDFAKAARARFEDGGPDTSSDEQSDPDQRDRPLWGEATGEEARQLIEDGIPILPVPKLPEDSN